MNQVSSSTWIKSTCAYCGVGCGIEAKVENQQVIEIRGDKDHPANKGALCSKGLALADTLVNTGRLSEPSIDKKPCNWDTANHYVADKFNDIIKQYGKDAIAFYVSGQLLTEDYYVANKLMKGFIGSGNIDTNSRLCMSSSVAGHKRAFGSDSVPGCYEDLEQADLIVLTGSNLAWCHPVIYQRIKAEKKRRPELYIVNIDPRITDTCEIADLHLAIKPGGDVTLFNGLLQSLIIGKHLNSHYIEQSTEGFQAVLANLQSQALDIDSVSQVTQLPKQDIVTFYQRFAATDKTVTLYSQGVNQSSQGTDKVNSIINCHLATGRIGKPGASPFSITGQPNAMGGREVGGLANTLAAHLEFDNDEHHQLLSKFWQTDNLSQQPGHKAIDLFDKIHEGKIKAVWIMGTNPVVSLPNTQRIIESLQKCELVVLSDCIQNTDTSAYADVLLPAQGWGEKSGTVTNSERCISRQRQLINPHGSAKPDWKIICDVAKAMGFDKGFNFNHEAEIFSEHATLTSTDNHGSRDLDLTGLSLLNTEAYDDLTPTQWPCPTPNNSQQRLFSDGLFFTPSKKAHFIATTYDAIRKTTERYPLVLNTGRIRDQWHTMSRTGLSAKLSAHAPEPFVNLHPNDAQKLQLIDKQLVVINSELGSVTVRLCINKQQQIGQIFCPMHWNNQFASNARIDSLIKADLDPLSGQPDFKHTAVNIEPFKFNSEAYLLSRRAIATETFSYWSKQAVNGGYLYRISSDHAPEALNVQLQAITPTTPQQRQLCFDQHRTERFRRANITGNKINNCVVIAPNLQDDDYNWLENLLPLTVDRDIESSILTGNPADKLDQGKIICACKIVGEKTITRAIDTINVCDLEQLSQCTSAGTGCGSCKPELQQLLTDHSSIGK